MIYFRNFLPRPTKREQLQPATHWLDATENFIWGAVWK